MIDIFLKEDITKLVKNRFIVFMGDSNIRALYNDFLCLWNSSSLISQETLRKKMEPSIFRDKLKHHGPKSNGRDYREEREFDSDQLNVKFYFLTRVYDKYVKAVLEMITATRKPDVLVINCCLWDVTRWGATGVEEYKLNLQMLMKMLKQLLPDCLVIWMTTPPISAELKGGFLVQEIEFLRYSLRFHVMEANQFARKVVVENGFDILDTHYHLKMQIHRRTGDGIHWLPPAVRYITNLLLTHISLAWNVPLPHRYQASIMEKNLNLLEEEEKISAIVSEKEKKPVQKENTLQDIHKPPPSKKRKRAKRQNQYNKKMCSPQPSSSRNDSGYFTSPTDAFITNETYHFKRSRNITFTSPHGYTRMGFTSQESYAHREVYQSYDVRHIPLPSVNYQTYRVQNSPSLFETHHQSYPVQRSPLPYRRGPLLQEPYSFPHVPYGETLRPKIDFTSDDFLAF